MLYETRLNTNIEDIGCALGYTATCTLVEWFGGTDLWVPLVPDPEHEISKVIGHRAFIKLVELFPGQAIPVPTDYFREITRRDRIVVRMVRAGNGTKTIAATVGLTERQVQYIRKRLETAGLLPKAR